MADTRHNSRTSIVIAIVENVESFPWLVLVPFLSLFVRAGFCSELRHPWFAGVKKR